NTTIMLELAEILFAHAEERGTVKLRVSADVVVSMGMQVLAVFVFPKLFGVVLRFDVDGLRVPVVALARDVIAALQDQDLLPGGSQVVGECTSTSSRSDNDDVVVLSHRRSPLLVLRC